MSRPMTIRNAEDRLMIGFLNNWKQLVLDGHSFEDVEGAIDTARTEFEIWINEQIEKQSR